MNNDHENNGSKMLENIDVIHNNQYSEYKISIIISKCIERNYICKIMESIYLQDINDIEIIFICSDRAKNNIDLLKNYAYNDKRISIISNKLDEIASQKNSGLIYASGEYVIFIDDEIIFRKNILGNMYEKCKQHDIDMLIYDASNHDDSSKDDNENWISWIKYENFKLNRVYKFSECPENIITRIKNTTINKIYKRRFIVANSIYFFSKYSFEDIYFSIMTTIKAHKILFSRERCFSSYNKIITQPDECCSINLSKKQDELFKSIKHTYNSINALAPISAISKFFASVCIDRLYNFYLSVSRNIEQNNTFRSEFVSVLGEIFERHIQFYRSKEQKKFNFLRNIVIQYKNIKEIPKRIFYVWGANDKKSDSVIRNIRSWLKAMPDYEIVEINENSRLYFDFQKELINNKWFNIIYKRKLWAYVADYIRINVLYENGGIYFDTDVFAIKCLEPFLSNKAFVGVQCSSIDGRDDLVEPAICGCQKNNEFFSKIRNFYKYDFFNQEIFILPNIFDLFLRKFEIFPFKKKGEQSVIELDNITIYPEDYFIPFRFGSKLREGDITNNTHTIHWFNGGWVSRDNLQFLRNKNIWKDEIKQEIIAVTVFLLCRNSEKFICQCISSIINQTLKAIEVICINAGSNDTTFAKIKKYASSDNRITVIDTKKEFDLIKNNILIMAKGEYIQIIDGKSWLETYALEYLYRYSKHYGVEIVKYGEEKIEILTNHKKECFSFDFIPKNFPNIFTFQECKNFIKRFERAPMSTFYSKKFLLSNSILLSKYNEYNCCTLLNKCIAKCQRISIIHDKLYKSYHETSNNRKKIENKIKLIFKKLIK